MEAREQATKAAGHRAALEAALATARAAESAAHRKVASTSKEATTAASQSEEGEKQRLNALEDAIKQEMTWIPPPPPPPSPMPSPPPQPVVNAPPETKTATTPTGVAARMASRGEHTREAEGMQPTAPSGSASHNERRARRRKREGPPSHASPLAGGTHTRPALERDG